MCIFFFLCQKWRLKFFKIWLTKCLINVIQGVIFLLWCSFSLCIDWYSHRERELNKEVGIIPQMTPLPAWTNHPHMVPGYCVHALWDSAYFCKNIDGIFNIISNSKILYQMLIILDIPKINSQRHVHCINKLGWILL